MRKINTYCVIIAGLLVVANGLTHGSEKNWVSRKMDDFTQNMLNRHTYANGSFEHLRDMGALFVMPKHCAQYILQQQRTNMLNFLKENEADALNCLKNEFNFDDEEWAAMMTTIQKESEFNLAAMQQKSESKAHRDPLLPSPWIDALKRECARHNLDDENVDFGITTDPNALACAGQTRPNVLSNIYHRSSVSLNVDKFNRYCFLQKQKIDQTAAHEMMHTVKGDHIAMQVIYNQIIDKSEMVNDLRNKYKAAQNKYKSFSNFLFPKYSPKQLTEDLNWIGEDLKKEYAKIQELYGSSLAYKNWEAAFEKTADTTIPCIDPKIAGDVASLIGEYPTGGYPANHNDLLVIDANWKTSRTIEKLASWRKIF